MTNERPPEVETPGELLDVGRETGNATVACERETGGWAEVVRERLPCDVEGPAD